MNGEGYAIPGIEANGDGRPPREGKLGRRNQWRRQRETTPLTFPKTYMALQQRKRDNDVNGSSSQAGDTASGSEVSKDPKVVNMRKPCEIQIGTWNVRTMLRRGKLENVKREMERNRINILGLSEVRWKEEGDFMSDDVRVIYSGGKEHRQGVAILLDKEMAKRVTNVMQCNDRMMMIKIEAEPVDIVIIQVYMPTTDHDDEEVEDIYEQLEELIENLKGNDNLIVMGDWNASVGEGREGAVVGEYGLGRRNERGERLAEFCRQQKMVATNTWYQQAKRRRYTWKKPGDTGRYQLDYILVRQRFRNSVKKSCSYPGADVDSDHNLVAMRMAVKLKKIKKMQTWRKWDKEVLKGKEKLFKDAIEYKVVDRTGQTVEERWIALKQAVIDSAQEVIGYTKKKAIKKPWITAEMIDRMEKRRKWKNNNTDTGKAMYRKMNNALRRETDQAREKWWAEECSELEEMDRRGRSDLVYGKVKQLTKKYETNCKSTTIKSETGELLTQPTDIRNRWKEYIETLYDKDGKPRDICMEVEAQVEDDRKGPELLRSEIEAAIRDMKKNKAEGIDEIPAEFWKVLGEKGMNELIGLSRDMYEQGIWPKDFKKAVMIPLKKKPNAVECEDFRTISLIPHASKIMLRILTKRIEAKAKDFIGRSQFGFRKGCGTREAIGVLKMLCQRSIENDNPVYICFVDFEKAFDRVNWIKMMDVLKSIQVDWRDRRLIKDLYMEQEAIVRIADGESDPGIIGRGVRQGCPLSPILFSIYAEMMMKEAMDGIEEGVRVGGEWMKDVRFADDQAMIASTEVGLQRMMKEMVSTAEGYNMKLNVKKTKTMLVAKKNGGKLNIVIDGQLVEQVSRFKYLGAMITEDGRSELEVKVRIGMAKTAFNQRRELLTRNMSRKVKKKIIKTVVWSVALYGCETWTLRKDELRRLEALEMWLWRKMEKISWTERKTNEEVLKIVGENKLLIRTIINRKKTWIGHVVRGEGLLKLVMEGRMEGRRPRGRRRIGMIDDLTKGSYVVMKRRAEDREKWRCWMP